MRRTLSTTVALIAGVLVMIWAVPAVSDADSGWLKEQPVRGRIVDVENLKPGSASPEVKAPSDGLPPELGGTVQTPTVVVVPGLEFNLVGAVGRRDQASGQGDPQVAFRTSADGESWSDWMILSLAPASGDVSAQELMAEPFWVGHGRYVQFTTCLLYTSPSPRDRS